VSNGAHVGVRDIWYDGSDGGGQIAEITGASTFTYAGSTWALGGAGSISFNDFHGRGGAPQSRNVGRRRAAATRQL
jgi:hypothetical protein